MTVSRSQFSVDLGRGTRRFQRFVTFNGRRFDGEPPRPKGVLDPDCSARRCPTPSRKLDPVCLIRNPVMFVVDHGRPRHADLAGERHWPPAHRGRVGCGVPVPDRHLALVHGPLRNLRRGRRRGPRPGPGRDASKDPVRDHRPSPPPGRLARVRRVERALQGRHHRRRGGPDDRR